jgi:hypothetical protein
MRKYLHPLKLRLLILSQRYRVFHAMLLLQRYRHVHWRRPVKSRQRLQLKVFRLQYRILWRSGIVEYLAGTSERVKGSQLDQYDDGDSNQQQHCQRHFGDHSSTKRDFLVGGTCQDCQCYRFRID